MFTKCALALVVLSAAAGPVNLSRTFTEGASRTYEISATDKSNGARLDGKLTLKALAATKDGKTSIQLSGAASMTGPNGQSQDQNLDLKSIMDAQGMPAELSVEGGDVVATMLCLASYLPAKEVEVGKDFPVEWKSGDRELTGVGTLKAVEDKDGLKIAVIAYKTTFKPGDETPGTLKLESRFDLSTGALLSCEGKVEVEGQVNMDVQIKSTK